MLRVTIFSFDNKCFYMNFMEWEIVDPNVKIHQIKRFGEERTHWAYSILTGLDRKRGEYITLHYSRQACRLHTQQSHRMHNIDSMGRFLTWDNNMPFHLILMPGHFQITLLTLTYKSSNHTSLIFSQFPMCSIFVVAVMANTEESGTKGRDRKM